jgi:TonB-dependent receptor
MAGQFDQLSGHDYDGEYGQIQTEFFTASLEDLIAVGEASYIASGADYEATGDCGTGYCASTEWGGNNVSGYGNIYTLEESQAAYVRYSLNTEVSGMPTNLYMGLRYEQTDITSQAVTSEYDGTRWSQAGNELYITPKVDDGSAPTPFYGDYSFLLPSLDFDIEVVEDVILRASFSESITRPSYNDIKGGLTANSTQFYADGLASASAGNPDLEPILSRNLDLSAEWYYGESSYLSIGYFDKDVDKFIGSGIGERTLGTIPNIVGGALWDRAIAESGIDPSQYTIVAQYILDNYQDSPYVDGDTISGAPGDPDLVWRVTQPVNQKKARVDGVEVNLQHNFGDTGYGFIANATFADADVGYDNMNSLEGQFVLNGLSDSANLIGFYDKDGLSVRLAYNWRDDFLAGVGQGQGTTTNPTNVEAFGQLDLGITYEYSDRVTIYASGLNITEETVHVYGLSKAQTLQAVQGGARYDLAIRYKLF